MTLTYGPALMLIEPIKRYIVLALDEQKVRWYLGMFEFECVIAWYTTLHHDTITIEHSPAIQLQWQLHTALRWCQCCLNVWNAMTNGCALLLIEFYGTVLYRVAFGRTGSTLVHI